MARLIAYILFSFAVVLSVTWLLALPGSVRIDFAGYILQPKIGISIIILSGLVIICIFIWSLISRLLAAPRALQTRAAIKRQNQGIDALSNSLIALQAGDSEKARQLAQEAQYKLADNSAAHLLQARADLALGNMGEAREQYRQLLENSDTSLAALSGLYEQAKTQNRADAALTFAQKAHTLSPQLPWANRALFNDLTKQGDWAGALKMVHTENPKTRSEKQKKKRKLAVLHTAIAAQNEVNEPNEALDNARVALKLEPDFVPAALIAARIHSNKNEVRKSTSLLRRVWRATHHPHVAMLYANAQPGISPKERLKRLSDIISSPPETQDAAIILAQTAIAANDWSAARNALADYADKDPSQGTCVAMAQIEEGQNGDHGRARQWYARAINAPRDPVWVANGVTAHEWAPLSPITGELDAFEFKVPTSAVSLSENPPMAIDVKLTEPEQVIEEDAPDIEEISHAHSEQQDNASQDKTGEENSPNNDDRSKTQ